jgi:hypothetical protein
MDKSKEVREILGAMLDELEGTRAGLITVSAVLEQGGMPKDPALALEMAKLSRGEFYVNIRNKIEALR